MDVNQELSEVRDAISAKWVFGHPIHQGGVTLVPMARVRGGGGGGRGGGSAAAQAEGSGGGFGLSARPAGAFVLRGSRVRWQPAVDVNRIILGMQLLLGLLILSRSRALRRREREPRLKEPMRRARRAGLKGLWRRSRFA